MFHVEIPVNDYEINPIVLHEIEKDELSSVYQFLMVITKWETSLEVSSFGNRNKHLLLRYIIYRLRLNIFIRKMKKVMRL